MALFLPELLHLLPDEIARRAMGSTTREMRAAWELDESSKVLRRLHPDLRVAAEKLPAYQLQAFLRPLPDLVVEDDEVNGWDIKWEAVRGAKPEFPVRTVGGDLDNILWLLDMDGTGDAAANRRSADRAQVRVLETILPLEIGLDGPHQRVHAVAVVLREVRLFAPAGRGLGDPLGEGPPVLLVQRSPLRTVETHKCVSAVLIFRYNIPGKISQFYCTSPVLGLMHPG
eukprot:scaffold22_cov107-Isochrysis_galbana.AAC.7